MAAQAPAAKSDAGEAVRLADAATPPCAPRSSSGSPSERTRSPPALSPNPTANFPRGAVRRRQRRRARSTRWAIGPADRAGRQAPAARRQREGGDPGHRFRAGRPAAADRLPGQEVVHRHPDRPGGAGPRRGEPPTLDEIERVQRFRAEQGRYLRARTDPHRGPSASPSSATPRTRARRSNAAKIALRTAVRPDRLAEEFDVVGNSLPGVPLEQVRALPHGPRRAAGSPGRRGRAREGPGRLNLARANAWWDITPQLEYQRIGPDNTIGFGISLPDRSSTGTRARSRGPGRTSSTPRPPARRCRPGAGGR